MHFAWYFLPARVALQRTIHSSLPCQIQSRKVFVLCETGGWNSTWVRPRSESGIDSPVLAVLHICSERAEIYNKTTFYFKNITFIHNYDRGVHLPFMPYSGYCCTTIIFTSLNAGNKIIILAMTEWAKIIYCRLSVFFVCCFLGGGVGLYFCFHCSVHFCIYIVQLFKSMHCSIC